MADSLLDQINLPGQSGTPVPATSNTPLGASLSGANADQAKMAGTPNQVASAAEKIQQAGTPPQVPQTPQAPPPTTQAPPKPITQIGAQAPITGQNYADYMRTLRPDIANQTAQEQAEAARIARVQAVGQFQAQATDDIKVATGAAVSTVDASGANVGTSVTDMENATTNYLQGGSVTSPTLTSAAATASANAAAVAAGKTVSATTPGAAIGQVSNITAGMGGTDIATLINQVIGTVTDPGTAIQTALANTPEIIGTQLATFAQSKGINLDQVAKDVGLKSAADFSTMSPQQLITSLQTGLANNIADVQKNKDILGNPSSSPAERQLASQSIVRQGALGITTAAEQAASLNLNLHTLTNITIAGTTYQNLADVLNNSALSALMTRAMVPITPASTPAEKADSNAAMAECEKLGLVDHTLTQNQDGTWNTAPGAMVPIMNEYNGVIKNLATEAQSSLATVIQNQKDVQALATTLNTTTLTAMGLDTSKGLVTSEQIAKVQPFLDAYNSITGAQQAETAANFNELALTHPELLAGTEAGFSSITALRDPTQIANQVHNVTQMVKAVEASDTVSRVISDNGVTPLTWESSQMADLEKAGVIDAATVSSLKTLGYSPSDILPHISDNVSNITGFMANGGLQSFTTTPTITSYTLPAGDLSNKITNITATPPTNQAGFITTTQEQADAMVKLGTDSNGNVDPNVQGTVDTLVNTAISHNVATIFTACGLPADGTVPSFDLKTAAGATALGVDMSPVSTKVHGSDWVAQAAQQIMNGAAAFYTKASDISTKLQIAQANAINQNVIIGQAATAPDPSLGLAQSSLQNSLSFSNSTSINLAQATAAATYLWSLVPRIHPPGGKALTPHSGGR